MGPQKRNLTVENKTYTYHALSDLNHLGKWQSLPYSLKIILENLWRAFDGESITENDLKAVIEAPAQKSNKEISFRPARVLMQDFTGVPAVVDLAAMRKAMLLQGGDPKKINPLIPVDLVIDHSVMVDSFGSQQAYAENVKLEYQRNFERYAFLRWGQKAFENFRVVPPGTGICHQVNTEYLAKVVWSHEQSGETVLYPDTLVGTDSHTTMVNGMGVLGWGVGGIEAEAAMLGQAVSMLIPEVVGVRLTGKLKEGCTATDLVLTLTQILRKKGVVGKFVEYFGEGVQCLALSDRTTIANMAPEYGATCGFFAIDEETLNYLHLTGRDAHQIKVVEAYAKAQGLWRDPTIEPIFNDYVELDLSTIQPSLAGPKRPQDKVLLSDLKSVSNGLIPQGEGIQVENQSYKLHNHDVVIAAITSCTNTSNPSVMVAAGLVAKKAQALGLKQKPWVKTSLAPGSQVVTEYLTQSGLMGALESVGFHLVGYGCTTCIGNSGPLDEPIAKAIEQGDLTVAGVLSGNRNFEGRINPHVKANYLASPPLVVAFALAGTTAIDLMNEPLGHTVDGKDVYLKDIWPSSKEIEEVLNQFMTPDIFKKRYATVFEGDDFWQSIKADLSVTYEWDEASTYVKEPPYFDGEASQQKEGNIEQAYILAMLGDSVTTDHISPAGSIKPSSPAGIYLQEKSVSIADFNSYGARRGNHEVMMRGTFANIRLQNEMVEKSGGLTRYLAHGKDEQMSIFDAAQQYAKDQTPLVIFAGKEYGTGSSRDWAAKGTNLLGVKAVIAESFERIHRSNLVGMGVLPLQFLEGENRKSLYLTGVEKIDILGLENGITPGMTITIKIYYPQHEIKEVKVLCRVDTLEEVGYFNAGGILPYVLKGLK